MSVLDEAERCEDLLDLIQANGSPLLEVHLVEVVSESSQLGFVIVQHALFAALDQPVHGLGFGPVNDFAAPVARCPQARSRLPIRSVAPAAIGAARELAHLLYPFLTIR